MKFTLSWLKDHLDTKAGLDDIVAAMTMAGLEVEDVIDPAAQFAAFSVGKITAVAPHPNADKLQVCQVDTRDGPKEIVCGALNARPGLLTVYAPIGTYIPGSGITLEPKPVRGVVSHGMLCSEAELGLEDDYFGLRASRFRAWAKRAKDLGKDEVAAKADGGIAELPDDSAVGAGLADVLGLNDPVIDFEVTPNRGDWLGVVGIARDLAAAGLGRLKTKPPLSVIGRFKCPITAAIDAPNGCPLFTGRMIQGVTNVASPRWLQDRLKSIGLKPRSALVDITNYINFDRGRPLHAYDASRLSGTIRARYGRAGESFVDLTGREVSVGEDMVVIADDKAVLGLGGIIGGLDSACTDATTSVFLECALFDPTHIFRAGRATGINTDARYRFERTVDPGFVWPGLELATRMILEICGGEASEAVSAGQAPPAPTPVLFDPDHTRRLAGMAVSLPRTRAILKVLGFDAVPEGGASKALRVTPPTFRPDIRHPTDLVEEIARIEGFDKLPTPQPRSVQGRRPPVSPIERRARLGRRAMASLGFSEAVTWSFCARAHAKAFGGGAEALVLSNPIAAELDCMRPTPIPNLARAAQRNLDRGRGDVRLFEVGPSYLGDGERDQRRVIAAVHQARTRRSWHPSEPADVFAIKATCLAALAAVGAPSGLTVAPAGLPWLHPGRSGAVKLGQSVLAVFGELHPATLAALDVEGPVLAFEIVLDAIPVAKAKAGRARPTLERLDQMPLSRDFAFLVDDAVPAADVVRAALGADKALIADVRVFDLYRGPGVAEGKKSLAIEVQLQPRQKTLTDSEIETVSAKIIGAVAKATGGTLRG